MASTDYNAVFQIAAGTSPQTFVDGAKLRTGHIPPEPGPVIILASGIWEPQDPRIPTFHQDLIFGNHIEGRVVLGTQRYVGVWVGRNFTSKGAIFDVVLCSHGPVRREAA